LLNQYFGIPIYFTQLDNVTLQPVLLELYKNVGEKIYPNLGNAYLTFGHKKSVLPIEINNLIINEFSNYLNELKIPFKKLNMLNDWFVGYGQNQYIDIHDHGTDSNLFSGIYYVKSTDDSPNLEIVTPNPYYEHIFHQTIYNEFKNTVYIKPIEGNLLFWPSFLRHYVRANPTTSERIAVSFNIGVEQ
jgi:uncharacterized protein (TIGR02466 family)